MTREEQERIVELRLKGLGYKAIANDLGTVSKESVRYYCKNHGLGGSAALVTMNYDCTGRWKITVNIVVGSSSGISTPV